MDSHFHLLLLTGETSLASFMRRLLTGYAVWYNKTHKRIGHLFQNRYKSILCDKDAYLLTLIRYIHLNPVKIQQTDITGLRRYKWTGHREMIIKPKEEEKIIEREEILGYFGEKESSAVESYLGYVREGLDLKGNYERGGLIRSAGGIVNVLKRGQGEREMYDERILGRGDFVEQVYKKIESKENNRKQFKTEKEVLGRLSRYYKIAEEGILKGKSKRSREARSLYIYLGNRYIGESATELGKRIGIKQSCASILRKKGEMLYKDFGDKLSK